MKRLLPAGAPRAIDVTLLVGASCGLLLLWTRPDNVVHVSWPRYLTALAVVLLVPGAAFARHLGLHARNLLEFIAVAFGVTAMSVVPLALVAFALKLSSDTVAAALLVGSLVATLGSMASPEPGHRLRVDLYSLSALCLICGISCLFFVRGDSVTAVGWEVGLHISWARQYASDLPLSFARALVRPDLSVPNIFFLWEFLLALVARVAGIDIALVFLHARGLVPLLSLASLTLMARQVLGPAPSLKPLPLVIALLAGLQTGLLDPLPPLLRNVLKEDRLPGLLLGSVHHSDTAMDILLPLLVAALFGFLRHGGRNRALVLAAALMTSFFWHPREYFQVIWYGVVALALDLMLTLVRRRRMASLRRHAATGGVFVLVTFGLIWISHVGSSGSRDSAAELQSKHEHLRALADDLRGPRTLLSASGPWRPPFHIQALPTATVPPASPSVYSFSVAALLGGVVLALRGRRIEAWLALYYLVLWWSTLCVPLVQQTLILATYSEILVSAFRFLPVFAIVVAAAGICRFVGGCAEAATKGRAGFTMLVCSGVGGALLTWLWAENQQELEASVPALTGLFAWTILLLFVRLGRRPQARLAPRLAQHAAVRATAFVLLLAPVSAPSAYTSWRSLLDTSPKPSAIFWDGNPSGMSADLIEFIRARLPPRSTIQVYPGTANTRWSAQPPRREPFAAMVSIYAPVYQRPLFGYVLADLKEWPLAKKGSHPIYEALSGTRCQPERAGRAAAERRVDYILLQRVFFAAAHCLTQRRPDLFETVYANRQRREAIVRVRWAPPLLSPGGAGLSR